MWGSVIESRSTTGPTSAMLLILRGTKTVSKRGIPLISTTADLTLALARRTAGPPAIIRLPGTLIERSTAKGVR
jgi:hypothetical protein